MFCLPSTSDMCFCEHSQSVLRVNSCVILRVAFWDQDAVMDI
jgi:hypothetical protein